MSNESLYLQLNQGKYDVIRPWLTLLVLLVLLCVTIALAVTVFVRAAYWKRVIPTSRSSWMGAKFVSVGLVIILLLAIFASVPGLAESEDTQLTPMYPIVTDYLRIRSCPSTSTSIELLLQREDCFMVESIENGWAYGTNAGVWGYAKEEFLSTVEMKEDEQKTVIANGAVNVRKKPSKNSARVGEVKNGDAITVLGYKEDSNGNTWAKIKNGYIMAEFLH